jgi:polyhydroxyalkanoate synthesis regulator phasin
MATRKRASTRSKLLKRAVKAGRSALREAERRVPPDVRKQLERTIQDGQKTIHVAIKEVQTRLDRTARQADLDRAMKRIEGLSQQIRNLAARTVGTSTAARPARRKPATRKAVARKPAARKAAPKRTTARRATTRTPRAAQSSPTPAAEPTSDSGES